MLDVTRLQAGTSTGATLRVGTETASPRAATPHPTDTRDDARISAAARRPGASAPSRSTCRQWGQRVVVGVALVLSAGALSGCVAVGAGMVGGMIASDHPQQGPSALNDTGSGAHKIVSGVTDIGKGIGQGFMDGIHQIRDGWNNARPAAATTPVLGAPPNAQH